MLFSVFAGITKNQTAEFVAT